MFVKRYLVNDMQEAMQKIRKELGNDAVILNSRFVRQKGITNFFKKKRLEVVAAYDSKIKRKVPSANNTSESSGKDISSDKDNEKIERLNAKIEGLQNSVESLMGRFDDSQPGKSPKRRSAEVKKLYDKLIENDVETELADSMSLEVQKIVSKMEVDANQVMEQMIIEKLGSPSPINVKKYKRNTILFLGPTGVGKTTTLVKLAGHFVAEEGLKVGVINTDTFRVAANEQLKIYAEILNVPVHTAYSQEQFEKALAEQEDRDIILMDTAGRNCDDPQYKKDIENLIGICKPDEIFVTLSLSTGHKTLKKMLDGLEFLPNYKLILTKLDEVDSWGNILNTAVYSDKRVSYLTNGQNIPDDILEANPIGIASKITQ